MAKTVQTYEKIIDGARYVTEDFPGGEAVELTALIGSLFPTEEGQLVLGLIANSLGEEEDKRTAADVLGQSVGVLSDVIRKVAQGAVTVPGGVGGFLKRMLARTTCDQCVLLDPSCPAKGNVAEHFDTHFPASRQRHMWRVVSWVWTVNFLVPWLGDVFITGLGDQGPKADTEASKQDTSPG